MTSITAIALRDRSSLQTCEQMTTALRPFGRDGECIRQIDGAAMGVVYARRTPEDFFDRQPISIADGRFTLVADCRIDNRDSLLTSLGLGGGDKLSDAAITAYAFERWGVECFDRLRGDFAVAIWDATERQFVVARDPAGNAPLFVHASEEAVALASVPRALHAIDGVPRRGDTRFMAKAIREAGMFDSGSFWEGIGRVLPGHFGYLDWHGLRQERYWSPPRVRTRGGSFGDYAEGLREQIERAVSCRLRGTTEVATHLSAGLDSGTVTGAVATLLRGTGRVVTFTAAPRDGFDARQKARLEDESTLAAATAGMHANLEHVIVRPGPEWATRAIETVFDYWQAPTTNLCNLGWIEGINEAAHVRGLQVMMPASMGNLALSYDGTHAFSEPWAQRDWRGLCAGVLAQATAPIQLAKDLARALRNGVRRRIDPSRAARTWRYYPGGQPHADPELEPIYSDMLVRTLTRVDRGSQRKGVLGRWGIDIRDPSTDRDLMDYVASIPLRMFRRGGEDRLLIRAAATDWVAPETLRERRRGLQAADWFEQMAMHRDWVRDQLDAIEDHEDAARVVNVQRLRRIADQAPDDWRDPDVVADHRLALLRGISAGHFIRRAGGGNR
jgi:asparagine synthase (glutamine-hydrolysing)